MRLIYILSLFLALSFDQNLSANSLDPPKVPAVISQTEFDYQGEHYVVQLVPSSDATVRKVDANGGLFSEGDFALTSGVPAIVLRSGSKVLSEITALQGAEFVMNISESKWYAYGTAPLFLLTRKDKLPLIVVAQYGSSNGSNFRIYLITTSGGEFKITPVDFSDRCYGNEPLKALFGSDIQMLHNETKQVDYLCINGYDNSIGNFFTIHYMAGYQDEAHWELVEYRIGTASTDCSNAEG